MISYKTDIFGLKHLIKFSEEHLNDADNLGDAISFPNEVSNENMRLMESITLTHQDHSIVEIGIARPSNGAQSFTHAILSKKMDEVKYLGIDIDDKTFLNNSAKNIFTIQANSFEQDKIRSYMKEIGIKKISLLMIDGWHSINAVINDFHYADMLSEKGVIVFHDINFHPGPMCILDCIDESLFSIEKYCPNDWGMAVAYRK